eukprot:SAG22_NODE_19500_length_274_cov_0.868571_1_plen_60_part_00
MLSSLPAATLPPAGRPGALEGLRTLVPMGSTNLLLQTDVEPAPVRPAAAAQCHQLALHA